LPVTFAGEPHLGQVTMLFHHYSLGFMG